MNNKINKYKKGISRRIPKDFPLYFDIIYYAEESKRFFDYINYRGFNGEIFRFNLDEFSIDFSQVCFIIIIIIIIILFSN